MTHIIAPPGSRVTSGKVFRVTITGELPIDAGDEAAFMQFVLQQVSLSATLAGLVPHGGVQVDIGVLTPKDQTNGTGG